MIWKATFSERFVHDKTKEGEIMLLHSFIIVMLISLCPDEEPLMCLMMELTSISVVGIKKKEKGSGGGI